MEVNGQLLASAVFSPGKVPHCIGGWVGSRAGLDTVRKKIPSPAGNLTPVVQPEA